MASLRNKKGMASLKIAIPKYKNLNSNQSPGLSQKSFYLVRLSFRRRPINVEILYLLIIRCLDKLDMTFNW